MISSAFAARRQEGRVALVPYFTAGHPGVDSTVTVLSALADAGADVIEIGVPFSDPLADGPTIQESSFRSLEQGTTVEHVLGDVADFRSHHTTPLVLFTYLNPMLRYGVDDFLQAATEAGVNGLLLTDLPTGADEELESKVVTSELDLIRLIAPTTPRERLATVADGGSGFVYYISRTGVTGVRQELRGGLEDEVRAVQAAVDLPVAVGFGISTPEQAVSVGAVADGVVVGSALVRRFGDEGIDAGATFLRSLRTALDEGR